MNTMKFVFVFIMMVVLITLIMLFSRLHHRTVKQGELYGLQIGASKEELIEAVSESDRFYGGEFLYCNGVAVTHRNVEDLPKVMGSPSIMVLSGKFNIEFQVDNGLIVNASGASNLPDLVFQVGQSASRIEEFILGVLGNEKDAVAFTGPMCLEGFSVENLQRGEKQKYWEQSDIWMLGERKRFTVFKLFFSDNKLIEIDYRNYFTEVP